ncbi:hypothetical protein ml_516 [Mollivirus sibericum]|uniref:hypothetical protein n=1 Tax=Mollivirus sibericum TaxID=1678078 RepID=UPI0006B2DB5D|nr:hypothetical protein ml_8 [Mollivirus sibericum]YP_009165482.1 hypothetical protein ml_516 [Mollivirus sibericum]ALD61810.1 hypothetical protein ml_8 [Mollivirus sibericum]ALD62318.1 hypothetical protein ml_516 [Mollivirus sibericum]
MCGQEAKKAKPSCRRRLQSTVRTVDLQTLAGIDGTFGAMCGQEAKKAKPSCRRHHHLQPTVRTVDLQTLAGIDGWMAPSTGMDMAKKPRPSQDAVVVKTQPSVHAVDHHQTLRWMDGAVGGTDGQEAQAEKLLLLSPNRPSVPSDRQTLGTDGRMGDTFGGTDGQVTTSDHPSVSWATTTTKPRDGRTDGRHLRWDGWTEKAMPSQAKRLLSPNQTQPTNRTAPWTTKS